MSTTPGWYPLPNEDGMMDYWDGNAWAGTKQPLPPEAPAPNSQPINVPTPNSYPASGGLPNANSSGNHGSHSSQGNLFDQAREFASNKNNQNTGMQVGGGALIADGIVGFGEKRSDIFGALIAMILGIAIFFISLHFISGAKMQDHESLSQGTVTEISIDKKRNKDGGTKTTCYPTATYTVSGTEYTASSGGGMSPCPWSQGEKVDVFYDKSNPGDARISMVNETKAFAWAFPVAGALLALGGLGTFIVRALSIGAGFWLLNKSRNGNRRTIV